MHTGTTDAPRSGVARRSEPKGRKHGHSASAPHCRLRVRRTCGWHSVTGEQQTACSRQTAAEQPGSAERHVTLATPAVSQADQGRQRAAGHPAPTVTAGVAPATHLWRRDREAARPPAEAWSSEERGAPVRCAAPAQCYCARRITATATAPRRPLCCPPDRPGPLRVGSGQWTSAVSRCVGATGRLAGGRRAKV